MFNFDYKEIDFAHKLNGHTLPSDDFKKHMHDFYELIFFVHGDVDYMIESKSKKLVSNDIILIPAGLLHYGVANVDVEYERYVLKFPLRLINDTLAKEIQDFTCFSGNYPALKELFIKLDNIYNNYSDEHKYILMVNTLSEILINMQNKSKVSDELIGVYHNPVVSKVIAYINENIKKNINLTDICNDLNFSRAHISNEFSRVMKIPVMTYIRYKKIIAAHQKILEGNVKINEVAYEYGFEEYSTFYRNYIKIIGKPPYSNSKKN
ncbi:MAG: AraC family transcriptional regulator [Bacilli bacterium]